jgi:adenine-specific DNA-methyltransferase
VYYLTKGPLKFLLGLLNSKLYYFWLFNRGKRKGKSLELYAKPLSQIPIPMMPQEAIEELTERILTGENVSRQIDTILYKYFELTDTEIMDVELLYNRGKYVK